MEDSSEHLSEGPSPASVVVAPPPPPPPPTGGQGTLTEVRKVRFGLRAKLFAVFALVMFGYSVTSNGYLLNYFFNDKARYVLFSLHQGTESLCVKLDSLLQKPDTNDADMKAALQKELRQVDYASSYVFGAADGHLIHATEANLPAPLLWKLTRERAEGAKLSNFTLQQELKETKQKLFVSGCKILRGHFGEVWLVLAVDATTALSPTRALLVRMGMLFVALLALGFAVFWMLAKSLTRPLGKLTAHADNLGAGNYTQVIEVPNNDELGVLADSFQILSNRLEARETELEKTTELANQDFLTGLWNRRYMDRRTQEHVALALRYQRDLSVVYMDADHFKKVNDTYGHPAGDEVLKDFARILKASFRTTDLVGRVGGEEFIIAMPETNLEGAVMAAQKLRDTIKAHVFLPDTAKHKMTASIGVESFLNNNYKNAEELIAACDKFAYKSKTSGRDKISFSTGQIG